MSQPESRFSELLATHLPRAPEATTTIHHYTSAAGLMGIIESKCLHATDVLHLNDSSEYGYAANLMAESIQRLSKTNAGQCLKELPSFSQEPSQEPLGFIGVVSFSEHDNSLSQWRGYASGSGYSLGFDFNELKTYAVGVGWELLPCLYSEADQSRLMDELVLAAVPSGPPGNLGPATTMSLTLFGLLLKYAPLFKHPGFAEEKEWRLISPSIWSATAEPPVQFKAGRFGLSPFYKFPLATEEATHTALCSVRIGPTGHGTAASRAAIAYLESYGLEQVTVLSSDVPYRP